MLRHLAAQQRPRLDIEVDSAGTADYHIGAAPDARSQRAALRRGIDLSGMRARQVTADDFARFDFILAMDRENLRELEALKPDGSRAKVKLFRLCAASRCAAFKADTRLSSSTVSRSQRVAPLRPQPPGTGANACGATSQ